MASKPPTSKPVMKKISKPGVLTSSSRAVKTFSVSPWTDEGSGQKIVIYGRSGLGKTTLGSMAPQAIFIGADDGGRRIINPLTKQKLRHVPGINSYQDMRDALSQDSLWPEGSSVVVDTFTKIETDWLPAHILQTVKINGARASSFRKFGWDGDRHLRDHAQLLLSDFDRLVQRGCNVILLCQQGQIKVANAEGLDYLEDGPFLQHRNDCSTREEVKQWADHVLRIGYLDTQVIGEKGAKAGKVVANDNTRAIFSGGARHYTAKSRPINGYRIPDIIGFANEADNSLWQFIFEGATVEAD